MPARKKGVPGDRSLPRRIDDKDPCDRRCARQSGGDIPDAGPGSDLAQAEPLLEKVDPQALLADKAYDADALIDHLKDRQINPVIPPKANRIKPRQTDFALYRERNLIERFFNHLKQFRAIAT